MKLQIYTDEPELANLTFRAFDRETGMAEFNLDDENIASLSLKLEGLRMEGFYLSITDESDDVSAEFGHKNGCIAFGESEWAEYLSKNGPGKEKDMISADKAYEVLLKEAKEMIPFGSVVRVLRKAKSYELGWKAKWVKGMDEFVGGEYMVALRNCDDGFALNAADGDGEIYIFPFFVLEVVSLPEEFYPFQKVLCRDVEFAKWSPELFSSSYIKDGKRLYGCIGAIEYKMCIPYEGNEHMAGTDKEMGTGGRDE